ncbi:SprT family protein [Lederbergia ruris]|uniref:SprT family protein n=1 Tax=Lederbergia ruris TaxID=217495 RepID=UPI0039A19B22
MTNEELQLLVEQISEQYFNKPFRHTAVFNGRLRTTGGRYLLASHNIEINRKYFEEHGLSELEGIIKHELCHYHLHIEGRGYQHRDQDFKKLMKRVGAPRHCTPLQIEKRTRGMIHKYQCQDCSQTYERKRRVNTDRFVCGKCKGKLIKIEV